MTPSPPSFPGFDPGKLDPQSLMRLSRLVQGLPPEQLNRMQTLMHNMMAGYDVRRELEEFEKTLPAGFRDELLALMGGSAGAPVAAPAEAAPVEATSPRGPEMDLREARLTLLRGVAAGRLTPEEAERLLFAGS